MTYIHKFFGHLSTILRHKYWVFYYTCKFGIPFRGLVHDLSKFSPVEFFESVRFYNGNGSPINRAKRHQGYSLAWFHHKGRNKYHYEYWIDYLDNGGVPVKMPYKYVLELICDYLAAARTYYGKDFSYENEYKWWCSRRDTIKMHDDTRIFVDLVFYTFAYSGHVNSVYKIYGWRFGENIYNHSERIKW